MSDDQNLKIDSEANEISQIYYIDRDVLGILLGLDSDDKKDVAIENYELRLQAAMEDFTRKLLKKNGVEDKTVEEYYVATKNRIQAIDSAMDMIPDDKLDEYISKNLDLSDDYPKVYDVITSFEYMEAISTLQNGINKDIYDIVEKDLTDDAKQKLSEYLNSIQADLNSDENAVDAEDQIITNDQSPTENTQDSKDNELAQSEVQQTDESEPVNNDALASLAETSEENKDIQSTSPADSQQQTQPEAQGPESTVLPAQTDTINLANPSLKSKDNENNGVDRASQANVSMQQAPTSPPPTPVDQYPNP